ncbi:hypothetical protein HU200_023504 [Digitaria exilis]|uniref:Bidirectional sugar transporter SWEET n=1 Tax=Digitaria exilis TaxID=1010633 RepID=A0A835C3Y6_9POAL|nr:hypothetical protein HU200_023504 [Digitaria exilis]
MNWNPFRKTFRRIVRNKSTEDFRWLPYATTLLSTSLWTFYGLLKPGGLLIVTVNGAGAALEATYVTLFLIYAPKETKVRYSSVHVSSVATYPDETELNGISAKIVKLVLAVNVGFLAAVVLVTLVALHGGVRLVVVGVLCAALTIGMYAAPLGAMRTVIKTRSVEYMPFSLSFFLFLNGSVWSAYSVLVKDLYIGIPNAIGFVLGTAQLVLYMAYRKAEPASRKDGDSEEEEEADEEEGLAHLMTGQVELAQRRAPLHKGLSLPKPSGASPRNGLGSIIKSISATPVELHSVLHQHGHGHGRFEPVKKEDAEAN